MKVINKISVYEVGEDDKVEDDKIIIENHWNRNSFIVMTIGKNSYTILASELRAAITNATNAVK